MVFNPNLEKIIRTWDSWVYKCTVYTQTQISPLPLKVLRSTRKTDVNQQGHEYLVT